MGDADSTAVVGDPAVLGRATGDIGTRIPVGKAGSTGEWRPLEHSGFDAALTDAVVTADVVVVTGHLESTASARLLGTVCQQIPAEPTVLAIPSIPADGLSDDSRSAVLEVIDATGTTVPVDLGRIDDAFHRAVATNGDGPLEIATRLIVEWLGDVFETFRGPIAAGRCNQRSVSYELFDDGGVSLLYWGWGTREDAPETLLEHAASHRFCDGDRRTATGGFGFVRFGHEFTLGEFESVEAIASQRLRGTDVGDGRWLFCGDSMRGLTEELRLAHLVMDVDPESIAFL